jgi:HD-like signal output (HDOD) protein
MPAGKSSSRIMSNSAQPDAQRREIKLPPLPHTLPAILKLRAQKDQDVASLAAIIQQDPVLTAGVLRRVNSAYYGLSREIARVDRAIHLLGYREVLALVLAAIVNKTFPFNNTASIRSVYEHIMKHSFATAVLARHLAQESELTDAETAYTAGVMHQIGRLVMLTSLPQVYADVWLRLTPNRDLKNLVAPDAKREQILLHTNYVQVGTILAAQWKLPADLATVIGHHLNPAGVEDPEQRTLTTIVAVGRAASEQMLHGADHGELMKGLMQSLPLQDGDVERLLGSLKEHQDKAAQFAESMLGL